MAFDSAQATVVETVEEEIKATPREGWFAQARINGVHAPQLVRRAAFVAPVTLLSLLGALLAVQANGGIAGGWQGATLSALEALNVFLLLLASWGWFVGAGVCLFEALVAPIREMNPPQASGKSRTAILMPVCNEDPVRVFRAVAAMRQSVLWTAVGDIDFFVLSDTRDPAIAAAEEEEHHRILLSIVDERAAVDGMSRAVHYRRRIAGVGRKAGNVQEFCERWGGAYDYMMVLDADSMMSGRAIAHLIGRMDSNPRAGIVQAMCYASGKGTLFARMGQWGGRMGGPVLARGLAFWQGDCASWWGHNAIIRTRAFVEHCGLPHLPGSGPLSGEILCHDIVEAALMVRAGWEVRLDHEVGGSWEESPTNLVDSLARERRWCQGNMQHARIASCARGLAPTSRLHLAAGALHYAGSLPFILLVLADSLLTSGGTGSQGAGTALLLLVVAVILLPRLAGLATLYIHRGEPRWWGGAGALAIGTVSEAVLGGLIAPISMVFNTVFVISPLLGRAVGWNSQQREDRKPGWRETWNTIGLPLLLAGVAVLALTAWGGHAWAALSMAPGLLLAVPLAVATGCPGIGAWARTRGVFVTPEELSPPRELAVLRLEAREHCQLGTISYSLPDERMMVMPAQVLLR